MKFPKVLETIEKNLKLIVGIGGALVTIAGAIGVGFSWMTDQVNNASLAQMHELSAQISILQEQSENGDMEIRQSATRTELLLLIYHTPKNSAEIERVARHYFCELNGDWYMSSVYSSWANDFGGDISIITSCDPH